MQLLCTWYLIVCLGLKGIWKRCYAPTYKPYIHRFSIFPQALATQMALLFWRFLFCFVLFPSFFFSSLFFPDAITSSIIKEHGPDGWIARWVENRLKVLNWRPATHWRCSSGVGTRAVLFNAFLHDPSSALSAGLQMMLIKQRGYYTRMRDLDRLEKRCVRLNPLSGPPVQERHWHTGASSMEATKTVKWWSTGHARQGWEQWVCSARGEGEGKSYCCLQLPNGEL